MMKLLNREPTPEIIEELHTTDANYKYGGDWHEEVYAAMYDAAPEAKQEPVEIDWPEYHCEAMGCGLEDRNITDRYDAMRYGWDEAIERCAERIPENLFEFPPDAQVEIAKRDAQIAELEADQDKANAAVAIGNYLGKTYNYAWCDTSLASQTIDLLKEQAAEISRLKSELRDLHKRNYITHSLFETGDTDCPEQAKDSNGEVVLGVCKNCGRIEAELAEPCDRRKEITRLRRVIAKCKETLGSSISDLQEPNFVTLAAWRVKKALAAIKEEGL